MTVICVRDGVMAVDSGVSDNGMWNGTMTKWAEVRVGGRGYIAGTGEAGAVAAALRKIADEGLSPDVRAPSGCELIFLRPDGKIFIITDGGNFEITAPFFASGSGMRVATGAMAFGASAEQAAKIACEWSVDCREPVTVLTVKQ